MNLADLDLLKEWFAGFSSSFDSRDGEEQKNIALKVEHTRRVCANSARLAVDEGLDVEQVVLAEAAALFHDLGRFPQYRRHLTFNDGISVNHAELGANLLIQGRVLDKFPRSEQDILITAVRFHNCLAVPPRLPPESALFLRLVRDADKLDIWRVFIDYYRQAQDERASAVSLGFPDLLEWSPEILDVFPREEIARLALVKTLTDFKLLQLSWVYDLNYPSSFRMLLERDYINLLALTLPDCEDVGQAVAAVTAFARRGAEQAAD